MKTAQLQQAIRQSYEALELNNFKTLGEAGRPLWGDPFFGISRGDDPLYAYLKEHIGPFHWSPLEAFRLGYPGLGDPAGLRVVSICFPQTERTKHSQSLESVCPSRDWIVSRGEWEPMIREFSSYLTAKLHRAGVPSVAVDLLPGLRVVEDSRLGFASTWSQRHAAYISGLGTFGLSDGLITKKGKAVRFTTLILEAPLEVPPRPYASHLDWCAFYRDGSCGVCIDRCPARAIGMDGHDKNACAAYEDIFVAKYWPADIDRTNYKVGCGLCQAGIPCQDGRPWEE